MGLKSFSGDFPALKDISIAKNYLNDEELKILNNIVSGSFDFAENAWYFRNALVRANYNDLKNGGERNIEFDYRNEFVDSEEKMRLLFLDFANLL